MSDRFEIVETENLCIDCGTNYEVFTVKDNEAKEEFTFCLCNECLEERNEEAEKENCDSCGEKKISDDGFFIAIISNVMNLELFTTNLAQQWRFNHENEL
jgi:hypothetical protein